MKFSNFYETYSWQTFLLALCAALLMWYFVSVRDRVEAQFEIRLDYKGPPTNLVVTDGLVNKMTIRVQGPEALLRSVNPQRLIQVVNLSDIKKGANVIPLVPTDWSPNFRAFEVVEVIPPRLNLTVESIIERTVPVTPHVKTGFSKPIVIFDNLRITPELVTIRGPESNVIALKSIPLTIHIEPNTNEGEYTQKCILDVPSMITATPATIEASYKVTSKRIRAEIVRPVQITGKDKEDITIVPASWKLHVDMPEALEKNASYLRSLQLTINPPPLTDNIPINVPLEISLPKGMTLLTPIPDTVTVTKGKK